MSSVYKLAEHFVSINGEGQRAGELALFLRFSGCNLACAWCDTVWANQPDAAYTEITADECLKIALDAGVHNVTLTGGEPLLQPAIRPLIEKLLAAKFFVEIETNGSVPIPEPLDGLRPSYTMDYKLPSSRMESKMHMENLRMLTPQDTLKFVCAGIADLERAREIMEEYRLIGHCKIYISPVYGAIKPAEIVDYMKMHRLNGVRLQLQLHKFIWPPDARGV